MQNINDNELCKKLIHTNPNLKVILMSAYTDVRYDKEKFLFVNKPIRMLLSYRSKNYFVKKNYLHPMQAHITIIIV